MPTHQKLPQRLHTGDDMRAAAAHWLGAPINGSATVRDRHGGAVEVRARDVAQHLGRDSRFSRTTDLPLVLPAIAEATALTEISPADKREQRARGAKRSDAFYSAELSVLDPRQKLPNGQPASPAPVDCLTYVQRVGRDRYDWVSMYPVSPDTRASREAAGLPIWRDPRSASLGNPAPSPHLTAAASRPERLAARHAREHATTPLAPVPPRAIGKLAALLFGVALLARLQVGPQANLVGLGTLQEAA